MTSSHPGTLLQLDPGCNPQLCPATIATTLDFVVCSLPEGSHETHQLRCETTGELLGEWTDADKAFCQATNEVQRQIEFSDTPGIDFSHVA